MWLLAPFRLVLRSARRFQGEQCAQTAAALSFATLLGLCAYDRRSVCSDIELAPGRGMGSALEKFLLANLLPDKAGVIIAKYIGQFALRAERVTFFGLLMLVATALIQMLTIERAFNQIWRVKASRPLLRRLAMHALAMLLGPVAFGASLAGISYVAGISLGFFDEPRWVNAFVGARCLAICLHDDLVRPALLGRSQPPIKGLHAAFGGAMGRVRVHWITKIVHTLHCCRFQSQRSRVRSFFSHSVFLAWLYASWSVILVGALLVAELPNSVKPQAA
jgi:membrane protein